MGRTTIGTWAAPSWLQLARSAAAAAATRHICTARAAGRDARRSHLRRLHAAVFAALGLGGDHVDVGRDAGQLLLAQVVHDAGAQRVAQHVDGRPESVPDNDGDGSQTTIVN